MMDKAVCCFPGAWLLLAVLLLGGPLRGETVYFNGTDFRGGYYLVPDDPPADGTKMWVVVDVHGAGGLRNAGRGPGLASLLAPEPVIVLVPSFTSGYQAGDGRWAAQLIGHFKTVRERHEVHDRMFVHGHSGGGQFAHRFAFAEPGHVVGVSAHSSGSWACAGGYGEISTRARGIPFTISCGEKDTAYSVQGYPHTRIEWFRLFAAEMEKKGFVVAAQTWPEAGHGVSARLYGPQLKECFLLATQGIVPTSGKWSGDVDRIAEKARREYGGPPAAPSPGPGAADLAAVRSANDRIAAGQAPDVPATMRFLLSHPAPSWAADESLSALRAHCRKAAEAYLREKREAGESLSGAALARFREVTEGLGVEE